MCAAVIAGVDAPPVFDFGEQVFDEVALFVDRLVVVILDLAVGFRRDAGGDAARGQRGAEPVAVIDLDNPVNAIDPEGLAPKDRWYGYNDTTFKRWLHRCVKQPGDGDASKEQIAEAYQEWSVRAMFRVGQEGPIQTPMRAANNLQRDC